MTPAILVTSQLQQSSQISLPDEGSWLPQCPGRQPRSEGRPPTPHPPGLYTEQPTTAAGAQAARLRSLRLGSVTRELGLPGSQQQQQQQQEQRAGFPLMLVIK